MSLLSSPTTLVSLEQVEVCLRRRIKRPGIEACGQAVCLAQQRWRRVPTGTKNAQVSENWCTTLQRRKRKRTDVQINRIFPQALGNLQVSQRHSRSFLSRDLHSCYVTANVSLSQRSSSLSGSLVRVSQHGDHVAPSVGLQCQQNEVSFEVWKETKHHLYCAKCRW